MKTTAPIRWYDTDTTDTIYLVAPSYGLEVIDVEKVSDNEIIATVKGEEEDVARLAEDVEEGDGTSLDLTAEMDDDEYQAWLKEKLAAIGKEYSPKA